MARQLRRWQAEALAAWEASGCRGIVGAVTGGGKTVFALACIERRKPETALIVVPTVALLDQWWEETAAHFGWALDDVNILSSRGRLRRGTVNIGVLNTAAKLAAGSRIGEIMLVVDECHKAASPTFRAVLDVPAAATLGLSATPERPYDDGLAEVLVPALGAVIYQYTYAEALRDGVIVPFELRNLVFELEPERAEEYERLTRKIARVVAKLGPEAPEAVALYLRRARALNLSQNRVVLTLKLIAAHRGQRTIVFHEDVEACEVIAEVLRANGISAAAYHSKLPMRERADMLGQFRAGGLSVLVTCRALDEGFNVPEAQLGIIAASTATRRQRIQRLGRVLRPSKTKERAVVYTLVATGPEIARLKEEEAELEGVADVSWSRA
ncbi:MAG: DEAD/DEAH box helicase [Armatimonadetes bacterium]|nr:DEAD/DEAH box helicase [Armatimonadota bacterium]MCA1997308.1 DEAD/DEAH box helicase [Armatimonadota bacterium]